MKKTLAILICLLATGAIGYTPPPDKLPPLVSDAIAGPPVMTQIVGGGVAAPPAGCDLLDYDAEGYADGTNLTSAGWSGSNTDTIEIDTSQYNAGSASIMVSGDTNGFSVTDTFTAQTSTFRIKFYMRLYGDAAHENALFYPVSIKSSSTEIFYISVSFKSVSVSDSDTPTDTTFDITVDTWTLYEFEVNPATDTYRVKIDGTERLTGTTLNFTSAVANVDTIYLSQYSESGAAIWWIDDICIETGGW